MLKNLQFPVIWGYGLGCVLALQLCGISALAQFPDPLNPPFLAHHHHIVGKHNYEINNQGHFFGPDLSGGLWVGAISGGNTLVTSVGHERPFISFREFQPGSFRAQEDNGELPITRNVLDPVAEDVHLAKSQDDFIVVYYNTLDTFEGFIGPTLRHDPLNLRVRQSSYAWGVSYADDFLLIDYEITNIGNQKLNQLFLGIYLLTGVAFDDHVQGFFGQGVSFNRADIKCSSTEDMNFCWVADIDGLIIDPFTGEVDSTTRSSASGLKILRPADPELKLSFNWWLTNPDARFDFGPRKRGPGGKPFPDFGGVLGTPIGDRNKYHQLSNGELDYDQIFTAVDHSAKGWLAPPANAVEISNGGHDKTAFGSFGRLALLSVGPFDLSPGQSIPFTVAVFVGEKLHRNSTNFAENFDPLNPEVYYDNLNFSGMIETATWARWVFDNPGFDTNGDGFRGQYRLCPGGEVTTVDTTMFIDSSGPTPDTLYVIDTFITILEDDTIWITGDGIPDFRGISAPPSPEIRYTSEIGKILLEWNGMKSETTADFFTEKMDFEGYRVYLGLVNRRSEFVLMASYDIEDYTQWYFDTSITQVDDLGFEQVGDWVIVDVLSKVEIQQSYARGDSGYDPLFNSIDNPLVAHDSVFFFTKQDWNEDDLTDTTNIHKIFPDATFPHTLDISEAFTEDTWYENAQTGEMTFYEGGELTEDGKRFKYFEYRMILENLLPSQVYYVSVTAFDFGDAKSNLRGFESSKVQNAVEALAHNPVDTTLNSALNVIVYPNPYRIDGRYRDFGFEGRGREDFPDERVRVVHWTNLPPVCDISIYSLDGDLVRTIEHRKAPDDPSAMHETWDVISRNTLPVMSGIYYWTVETPDGRTQIGKLVLIM